LIDARVTGPATVAVAAAVLALLAGGAAGASPLCPPGDGCPPLTSQPGDATRGRAIVASRQVGLCLLCHSAPIPEERFQGNLAPDLKGTGARWRAEQLRLRLVEPSRLNPNSMMPAYYTPATPLNRVPAALAGKTLLSAQQIEDVVAYLQTLDQP
jgi:sulfur-oxidizing protein SoxX